MNILRSEFAPSLLAFNREVSPVRERLKTYHQLRQDNQWKKAEEQVLDTLRFCRESDDCIGMALTQLHLALFYSEVGEISQAVRCCEEAYQGFRRQTMLSQRHNEALAAYALGSIYELFPSSSGLALCWYQEALRLLEMVKEYWASLNDVQHFNAYHQICRWTKDQVKEITALCSNQHFHHPRFDIWRLDSADRPFNRPDGVRGYIIGDDRVLIEDTYYRPEPAVDIGEDHPNYYFALPLQKDRLRIPEGETGDYMLIRQQWRADEEELGVIWESGRGWEAVNFTRGSDGEFRFDSPARKVIGGDPTGKLKGYVVAVLRPAPSTSP